MEPRKWLSGSIYLPETDRQADRQTDRQGQREHSSVWTLLRRSASWAKPQVPRSAAAARRAVAPRRPLRAAGRDSGSGQGRARLTERPLWQARLRGFGAARARLRAPLSLRNPARIQRTLEPPPPPRAGVKEHPSPLVTGTKTRGPSRQVKVQDAASPRLLPEGGGTRQGRRGRAAGRASAGFLPLHPLLIKVGSLHDNHGERA